MSRSDYKTRNRARATAAEKARAAELTERNAHVPRGRDVTVSEVQAYALSGHGKCGGRGVVGRVACACATKRFMRANPDVIVVREGDLLGVYWPLKIAVGSGEG